MTKEQEILEILKKLPLELEKEKSKGGFYGEFSAFNDRGDLYGGYVMHYLKVGETSISIDCNEYDKIKEWLDATNNK